MAAFLAGPPGKKERGPSGLNGGDQPPERGGGDQHVDLSPPEGTPWSLEAVTADVLAELETLEYSKSIIAAQQAALAAEGELQAHWDYIYEPDAGELLEDVLMRYIESQVYRGAVENVACEMAARMVAPVARPSSTITAVLPAGSTGSRSPRYRSRPSTVPLI